MDMSLLWLWKINAHCLGHLVCGISVGEPEMTNTLVQETRIRVLMNLTEKLWGVFIFHFYSSLSFFLQLSFLPLLSSSLPSPSSLFLSSFLPFLYPFLHPSFLFFSTPALPFFPSVDKYSSLFYYCCGKTLLQKATWGGKKFSFAHTYRQQPITGVSLGRDCS